MIVMLMKMRSVIAQLSLVAIEIIVYIKQLLIHINRMRWKVLIEGLRLTFRQNLPTIYDNRFASDKPGLVGCQKKCRISHIFHRAKGIHGNRLL